MYISVLVEKCQELLSKSERPLIILGSQAVIPPKYADDLRKALEVFVLYFPKLCATILGFCYQ